MYNSFCAGICFSSTVFHLVTGEVGFCIFSLCGLLVNAGIAIYQYVHIHDSCLQLPVPMYLYCPKCRTKHIDTPNPKIGWTNPPHRTHLCLKCGNTWRPYEFATEGIK